MRKTLLILLLCCVSAMSFAQKINNVYKVKGSLLDSISKEPVGYATISIAYKNNVQKAIKMLVSDAKGTFQEILPGVGEYVITFSSVGNHSVFRSFEITEKIKQADLGTIYTQEAVEELGDVVVVAQKPLVKVDVDKIAYDVASDPDSQNRNVLDMLRKVPLITIDGEDNIKLNGKTNFKIHLNGRPSNLLSNNPGKTLKGMPANSVKDIEIITNPGAKYDAEGVGGIINIITQGGKELEGYTATINTGVSQKGDWDAGASAMVKIGKFSVSASYSHNFYRTAEMPFFTNTEYYAEKENHLLKTNGYTKYRQPFDYGSAEASYEIDSLNLLTFTIGSYRGHVKTNPYNFVEMLNEDGDRAYSYETVDQNRQTFGGTELSLNYQRTLSKKDELLTLSYRFSGDPSKDSQYRVFRPMEGTIPFTYREQQNENEAHSNEHTVQGDYINPFNSMHTLEAGLKYIYRDNYSKSKYKIKTMQNDAWIPYPQEMSDFKQSQYVFSAYAAYTLKYKKMGLKLGARLEQSKLDAKLHSEKIPDFSSKFTDVVPTVNLSFKLSDTQTLRGGYNMRISRPGIWYLNPYKDERDPHFVSYGNPYLDSEKYQNVQLNYSNFTQRLMVNVGLSYNFCHNSIQKYNELNKKIEKIESTYGNIGRESSVGLGIYINATPFDGTNIWINGMINYSDIRSNDQSAMDARAKGWQWEPSLGFQQKLFWKLQLSAYGGYYSPNIQLQAKRTSFYYYGLTLRRDFLKEERLTVSLSASDFLRKYMNHKSELYSKDFYQWSSQHSFQRSFRLNISYRIGDLKTAVKKVARGIMNDDVKSGGGQQGQK